ncbi:hypothetical protein ACFLQW_03640 [Candidatus Zixiibacteriota bacterium]
MNRRDLKFCVPFVFVLSLVIAGCAGSRPDLATADVQSLYQKMRQRMAVREDSTHTASYRVRWRVREIEPHSEVILRIDYRAPGSYHVVGKGPMDVPIFTAWVTDSQYVLLAHRENQLERGHLRDLNPEDFTMDIRPLGGFLELFAGGSSIRLPESFNSAAPAFDGTDLKKITWADDLGRIVEFDLSKSRLKRIEWNKDNNGEQWELAVRFGRFSASYPYWELESAHWENHNGPGKYFWDVLARRYNPNLPDRLFIPPGE